MSFCLPAFLLLVGLAITPNSTFPRHATLQPTQPIQRICGSEQTKGMMLPLGHSQRMHACSISMSGYSPPGICETGLWGRFNLSYMSGTDPTSHQELPSQMYYEQRMQLRGEINYLMDQSYLTFNWPTSQHMFSSDFPCPLQHQWKITWNAEMTGFPPI